VKKQKYPPGWNEERVRQVIAHYDNQTEDEQAAEIKAARIADGQTMMSVPTELVPKVAWLIAQHQERNSAPQPRKGKTRHVSAKRARRTPAQKAAR
jgi:hypothetical protein